MPLFIHVINLLMLLFIYVINHTSDAIRNVSKREIGELRKCELDDIGYLPLVADWVIC